MRVRMATSAALAAAALAASAGAQEPPRVGAGVFAGTVFGVELMDHQFPATIAGESVALVQEVGLRNIAVVGVHGEWFVTRHLALRAHAARGGGRLQADTRTLEEAPEEASMDMTPYGRGFGDVGIRALDAGVSLWPWAPRTVGFAPFVTVGYGLFSYDFSSDVEGDRFFLADGERSGGAWVVGAGADMHVWNAITLRLEATNHIVASPLEPNDFATFGEPRPGESAALGDEVSNVRLVLGAHVYLPFDNGP